MGRYLIRRAMFLALVLWIVSMLTFVIFVKLPAGDPARRFAGRRTTPETIEQVRENLGLDKPVLVQYARFAKGLIPWPGLFLNEQVYFSYSNYVPVKEEMAKRMPVTFALAIGGSVLWLLIGIPIGIVSALKPRSLADRAGMVFALFGVSAPVFWLGFMLLYVFWFRLGWLPGSGLPPGDGVLLSVLHGRFLLPWVALALSYAALYTRMVRSNLMEVMGEDYIRTARSKGISERRVVLKHGLRSALTPVVTIFGMDLGFMLGGLLITETVFNLPGLGRYAISGITGNDVPAVMGVVVVAAFFIVVANLVVDVMYAVLDPRVRYS
ncbi:MAG: ABC transporter permease [Actinobacteria bacterium]|nr:ABC transporter permease [Actinomycetota bacterium]